MANKERCCIVFRGTLFNDSLAKLSHLLRCALYLERHLVLFISFYSFNTFTPFKTCILKNLYNCSIFVGVLEILIFFCIY